MSMEMFKELIKLLEGTTEGVMWVVIAYFGLSLLKFVLGAGLAVWLVLIITKCIKRIIWMCYSPCKMVARWRDRLGIGSPGYLASIEVAQVDKAVTSLVERHIAEKRNTGG